MPSSLKPKHRILLLRALLLPLDDPSSDGALVRLAVSALKDLRADLAGSGAVTAELDRFRAAASVLLSFSPFAGAGAGLRPEELEQYAAALRLALSPSEGEGPLRAAERLTSSEALLRAALLRVCASLGVEDSELSPLALADVASDRGARLAAHDEGQGLPGAEVGGALRLLDRMRRECRERDLLLPQHPPPLTAEEFVEAALATLGAARALRDEPEGPLAAALGLPSGGLPAVRVRAVELEGDLARERARADAAERLHREREDEVQALRGALAGEPGSGKARKIAELRAELKRTKEEWMAPWQAETLRSEAEIARRREAEANVRAKSLSDLLLGLLRALGIAKGGSIEERVERGAGRAAALEEVGRAARAVADAGSSGEAASALSSAVRALDLDAPSEAVLVRQALGLTRWASSAQVVAAARVARRSEQEQEAAPLDGAGPRPTMGA